MTTVMPLWFSQRKRRKTFLTLEDSWAMKNGALTIDSANGSLVAQDDCLPNQLVQQRR